MLAVNLLELLDRFSGVLFLVEEIEALVVEPVRRLIWRRVIFLGEEIETAAGAKACRQKPDGQCASNASPLPACRHSYISGACAHDILGRQRLEHEVIHAKVLPR